MYLVTKAKLILFICQDDTDLHDPAFKATELYICLIHVMLLIGDHKTVHVHSHYSFLSTVTCFVP